MVAIAYRACISEQWVIVEMRNFMTQHYFIGIHMGAFAAQLARPFIQQNRLNQHYKVLTHEEDYHLTLLYVGALTNSEVSQLQQALHVIANETSTFSITINGFHYFGNPYGPRVLYLSIASNDALMRLQKKVFKATTPYLASHVKNRFNPHITISKKRKSDKALEINQPIIEPVVFPVHSFELFSIHPRQIPKYQIIHPFLLQ